MKNLVLAFFFLLILNACSQLDDSINKKAILDVLEKQSIAWSDNDLEGFMEGYWKSDSLKFYGTNGVTYGWKNTLNRYQKGYPSKDYTGTLNFKIISITKIAEDVYYVLGEYHLERKVGDANGGFMVIFKKIEAEWKIIADTSF